MNLTDGTGDIYPGIFIFRRCVVQNHWYFLTLASHLCPLWTDWWSVRALRVHAVLLLPLLIYDPHYVSSTILGWCPCWASMLGFPLRFPISHSHMHDGSAHTSLMTRLFDAYSSLPGLQVWFVFFGGLSISTYIVIINEFTRGSFPQFSNLPLASGWIHWFFLRAFS